MKSLPNVRHFLADKERCRVSHRRIRRALEEVLSRLPDTGFQALLNGDRPLYVAESSRIGGVVTLGFPSGLTLLTLNEALKERPRGEIIGIIAHELAHLALDHRFLSWEGKRKLRLREEYEADALACRWGFQGELMAALEALTRVDEEARRRRERVS